MQRNQSGRGVGGSIVILKLTFRKSNGTACGGLTLAQNRDKWQAGVKAMVKIGFYQMRRNSWPVEEGLAFQDGLCSVGKLIVRRHSAITNLVTLVSRWSYIAVFGKS
jgi:hypothetical protein